MKKERMIASHKEVCSGITYGYSDAVIKNTRLKKNEEYGLPIRSQESFPEKPVKIIVDKYENGLTDVSCPYILNGKCKYINSEIQFGNLEPWELTRHHNRGIISLEGPCIYQK